MPLRGAGGEDVAEADKTPRNSVREEWGGFTQSRNCPAGVLAGASECLGGFAAQTRVASPNHVSKFKIMASNTDYIPAKIADFAIWLANFSALMTAAPPTFGLTAPDAVAVAASATAFADAYAISSVPTTRSTPTIAQTNAQRVLTTSIVRPYAVRIAANPAVTDENKASIGVTIRSLVPTPIPPPTTQPAFVLESAVSLNQTMRYYDTSTPTSKAKPFGAIGLQVWRSVGTVASVDPNQATYWATVTKSPFVSSFDAPDRGKIVTYWGRWTTASGNAGIAFVGPWSEPLSITVM